MAGSVTPSRRAREDDEQEQEDREPSVDGDEPASSGPRKRARLSNDIGVGDDGEAAGSDTGSLVLPDSFRRSPKGKNRATNGITNGLTTARRREEFKPGSLVRVTVRNFVTYTDTTFSLSPNLNMVIGPNGTGKSTLVCAMCLGLGWETKHLGRAKDISEYIKHGAGGGEIEIELAADPKEHQRNPVIVTKITRGKSKADYTINGGKSNKTRVQAFARTLNIQIDNLCQFLPQDRVVEFAALSPVDLLTQTQRAAAPDYMSEWHDRLKEMRREQKDFLENEQVETDVLKQLENRQRLQAPDVARLRERSTLQQRKAGLEKLRPFPEYVVAKANFERSKEQRVRAQQELTRLQQNLEPNLRALESKKAYHEKVKEVMTRRQGLVDRSERVASEHRAKLEAADAAIKEREKDIEREREAVETSKQSMPGLQRNVHNIERAIQNPPEQFDMAAMNEEIRQKKRDTAEQTDKRSELLEQVGNLKAQEGQRRQIIDTADREKVHLQSQAGQQDNKLKRLYPNVFRAWEWLQNNRHQFKKEVYGPPIVECSVKNPQHASAVEMSLGLGEMQAFTVTDNDDQRALAAALTGKEGLGLRGINIRTATKINLERFKAPMSPEQLRSYGLESWILDLIDGPDPVLSMLCDNRGIHQVAFTSRDLSEDQFNRLHDSGLNSWVTPKETYQISRRREYGPLAVSTSVTPIKPARFFTDAPVDRQAEEEIDGRIRNAQQEISEIREQMEQLKQQGGEAVKQVNELKAQVKVLEDDKAEKQKAQSVFAGLPVKLDAAKDKLRQAKEKIATNRDRRKEIIDNIDKLTLDKGQLALDYANLVDMLRVKLQELCEARILTVEAESDCAQLEERHRDESAALGERAQEVQQLAGKTRELRATAHALGTRCREVNSQLDDEERDMHGEVMEWTPDQLETEIESVQARLDMVAGGGGENTIREYEKRERDIEKRREKMNNLAGELEGIEAKIADVRGRWEPELDGLVAQISEAFAENFAKIQCAGEVAVHKDDDFDQWAIQIKVKFREQEQLSILDSHRQSGGERAVSTIFYLMALQSLSRAPFRVVDEINQGMDPRNERLVHSRMVEIACAEDTSQYFLITPKLLNGLTYAEGMRVHCIASGQYMPEDHRELDFGALAKKALEVKRKIGAVG